MADDGSAQSTSVWPLPKFHFQVKWDDTEVAFQEVSGLEAEIEVEPVTEGGENRLIHSLPKPVRHPNLVPKRGMAGETSRLMTWCRDVFEKDFSQPIVRRDVIVSL